MNTPLKISQDHSAINPLSHLSDVLANDMNAVNAQILHHMQSDVALIPKLASYLIASGGKRIRPLLTLASCAIFGGDMTRAHGLAAAVEFIHTATLLHDDVVDGSDMRRGKESANLVFGNQASVLVGDFLFSRAFQLMVADGSLDILKILSQASATIAEGEVLQLSNIGNTGLDIETYTNIVSAKTAALFEASCAVGPMIAGSDQACVDAVAAYGLNLGIAFQIVDDALDYDADSTELGKDIGDDFQEGKMTAPVILAYNAGSAEERTFWTRVMKNPQEQTAEDLQTALSYIGKHDTITQSMDIAQSFVQKAKGALKQAPPHDIRNILENVLNFVVKRSH